ncbi:MAG: radical SAM protein [Christensenellaceae bacterium]|nr:radical SAM protein [Christensenellaceae bacterium]
MDNLVNDIPVIKTFVFEDKFYCYDTYTNSLLNVTKEIYLEICELKKIGMLEYKKICASHSAYNDVLALIDKGLFRFDFIKEIIHPDTIYVEKLIERCISQLIIEVTSSCNFKCRYCHQTSEVTLRPKMLNEDIAYKSIDFLFEHSKDANEIAITFYGGEPLLNFEIIKKIVHYAKLKFESKPVLYNMTTNASLINEAIASFLVENNFSVLISLDGDEVTQNRHRRYLSDGGATFKDVWKHVLEIRKNYPDYFYAHISFNAVIMPDENPGRVRDFFEKNNIPKAMVTVNYADLTGIDYFSTSSVANKDEYSEDGFEEEFQDILERFRKKDKLSTKWHHNGPCVPAARRLFVSTDGNFYPCEKVNEAAECLLGDVNSGINFEKATELLNIGRLTSEDCKKCWAMRLCSMCVKQCLDGDSISPEKKEIACKLMRKNAFSFLTAYVENNKMGR